MTPLWLMIMFAFQNRICTDAVSNSWPALDVNNETFSEQWQNDYTRTTPGVSTPTQSTSSNERYVSDFGDNSEYSSEETTQGYETETSNTQSATDDVTQFAEEAAKYMALQVGLYIHLYYLPVVIAVGLLGNTLSLTVMLQKWNRNNSCCLYMAALAVSDNATLATGLWAMVVMSNPAGWSVFPIGCKVVSYTYNASTLYSILLVMAMTVDKCIAVTLPFKASRFCTTGKAKMVVLATALLSLGYNLHHPFLALQMGTLCSAYAIKNQGSIIFPWFSTALNFIIPFTAIFIMNILIVKALRERQKNFMKNIKQDESTKSSHQKGQGHNKDTQLTVMLLMVTFALFVLGLPMFLCHIVYSVLDKDSDPHSFAVYNLVFHFTNKLFWTNSAINFFCYCISGKRFRHDVISVLGLDKCGSRKRKNNRKLESNQPTLSTEARSSSGVEKNEGYSA